MSRWANTSQHPDSPVVVRLARSDEMEDWRYLMNCHHYLGLKKVVGKALYYIATKGPHWVALLCWGSAALKCAVRDNWIGWQRQTQWQRIHLIANNVRFLILPQWRIPNLASHILSLNIKRLSSDWLHIHGHPVLLAETFVDGSRYKGTCYRAAGWQLLGQTRGYSKSNQGYWQNNCPKMVFVRALLADADSRLRAPFLSYGLKNQKERSIMLDINRLPIQKEDGLMQLLASIVDPRKPRGVRHPVPTILAISVCAALTGARSFCAIAEWAQGLSAEALKLLGAKRSKPPSEPTIRRVLQKIDPQMLDQQISQWLVKNSLLPGNAVAVDGKTLRGSYDADQRPLHLLSAILHKEGVVIGQTAVEEKTNEIPKLKDLLDPLDLKDTIITADAMHTQKQSAKYIVQEKQADYLLIAKDNQSQLKKDVVDLNLDNFSP